MISDKLTNKQESLPLFSHTYARMRSKCASHELTHHTHANTHTTQEKSPLAMTAGLVEVCLLQWAAFCGPVCYYFKGAEISCN